MNTIKIYENYNMINWGPNPRYSSGNPITDDYRIVTVQIPEAFQDKVYLNNNEACIDFGSGIRCEFNELLRYNPKSDGPVLIIPNTNKSTKYIGLKVVEKSDFI